MGSSWFSPQTSMCFGLHSYTSSGPATQHLLLAHPALLVEKYQKSGFSWLWAASAFKGATGVNQSLTPIEHHLRNHLQWLQVAGSVPADTLRGIILTGWQR